MIALYFLVFATEHVKNTTWYFSTLPLCWLRNQRYFRKGYARSVNGLTIRHAPACSRVCCALRFDFYAPRDPAPNNSESPFLWLSYDL